MRTTRTRLLCLVCACVLGRIAFAGIAAVGLRCEYLVDPLGVEDRAPRLSWRVESSERGQRQTAYRILVATSESKLAANEGDLWDTGKVASNRTVNLAYAGRPLASRRGCYWKVQAWDKDDQPSAWSATSKWGMGLIELGDWDAAWISFKDTAPLHKDRGSLFLPPARHYRKAFSAAKPIALVDAAYYLQDAQLMAAMALAIGRAEEGARYAELAGKLRFEFAWSYVGADGALKVDTQTAHVLGIGMAGLTDLGTRLAAKIAKNDFRMTTGFLGTKALLPALSASGQHDLACRLFQSRKFPSWGYEVEQGATSVWERWDSFTKEHGFNGASGNQNASMNSFSHYSFGAAMEWAYRVLAGIDTDGPGFEKIVIRPGPPARESNPDGKPIGWVKAEYVSIHGRIASAWKHEGDRFELEVRIPANTTATVILPTRARAAVTEGGEPLAGAKGVEAVAEVDGKVVVKVGSGSYRFAMPSASGERR